MLARPRGWHGRPASMLCSSPCVQEHDHVPIIEGTFFHKHQINGYLASSARLEPEIATTLKEYFRTFQESLVMCSLHFNLAVAADAGLPTASNTELQILTHAHMQLFLGALAVWRRRTGLCLREDDHLEAALHLTDGQRAVQAVSPCQHQHLGRFHLEERLAEALIPPLPIHSRAQTRKQAIVDVLSTSTWPRTQSPHTRANLDRCLKSSW